MMQLVLKLLCLFVIAITIHEIVKIDPQALEYSLYGIIFAMSCNAVIQKFKNGDS